MLVLLLVPLLLLVLTLVVALMLPRWHRRLRRWSLVVDVPMWVPRSQQRPHTLRRRDNRRRHSNLLKLVTPRPAALRLARRRRLEGAVKATWRQKAGQVAPVAMERGRL